MASFGFLKVDDFLQSPLTAAALRLALDCGIIDRLQAGVCFTDALPVHDAKGKALLLNILTGARVVAVEAGEVSLTEEFRAALSFRDLLEAKLIFTQRVALDVHNLFPELINDLEGFMRRSETFALFRYDRCIEATPENVAFTREWMRYTTVLTRYESEGFLDTIDLGVVRTLIDVGGNSGEFALRLCRRHPHLRATVFDLPVVCQIGREHVGSQPEAARIMFHAGDMRREPLPVQADLVTFKSVLHDWPDDDARRLVLKAASAVNPGGRIAIFERGPLDVPPGGLSYAMWSNLVFYQFFRDPSLYVETLAGVGFTNIDVTKVSLDMPFHLVTATKPDR